MNNDFARCYLALLRKQVEDEIKFLLAKGHDSFERFISTPCMFCVQHQSGGYNCRRLKDLREFQSSILSNMHTLKARRRPIGEELKPSDVINFAMELTETESKPIFQMR